MRKWIRILLIVTGTMLILSALFLCLYNINESNKAYEQSQKVLSELKQLIPEPVPQEESEKADNKKDEIIQNPADDLFAAYEDKEEEIEKAQPMLINGGYYCGFITLPSLNLELPVADGWSYQALKNSPCRYSGSAEEDNIIIAAHNYNTHFGRIGTLNSGDEIVFTDTNGEVHRFEVNNTQYIDGYDKEGMFSGNEDEWDITLFTCTLNGVSRVTVRGSRIETEE